MRIQNRSRYRFRLPLVVRYVNHPLFLLTLLATYTNHDYLDLAFLDHLDWSVYTTITSIPRIDPPTPLRNPRSKQHNPTLHHLQKHAWEPISRKQKERGTIKLTRGSPTHRLPRPRRPPPRSLLRQARRPACCFHGPGLKPLFPTNRYLIPRRGGTHVQQTRQSLEARESEGEESKAQMITLKPYTMFLCVRRCYCCVW
jgi:hypothetical protein